MHACLNARIEANCVYMSDLIVATLDGLSHLLASYALRCYLNSHGCLLGESVNSGLDYWNGLLDWTTGLTFDIKFKGILYVKGRRSIATSHRMLLVGTWGISFV